jgi:hypothetical protein
MSPIMAFIRPSLFTFPLACISTWPAIVFAQTTLTPINKPIEGPPADFNAITVPGLLAAGEPVLESFVSFSIETAFFPDFAGNRSTPNSFSQNLLKGLKDFQGSLPNVRVGGNTQ